MEEQSRAATLEDLKKLADALNREGVSYFLIGGYALNAHGIQRATTDIDILVPGTEETGRKVKRALMILPDQAVAEVDPQWFEEGDNIRVADEFVVDIMVSACGQTYESLRAYAETVHLGDIPIMTLSLEGLLKTKQTLREKDLLDKSIIEAALEKLKLG